MEKFSNWRDKGTGISPFMPVPYPKSSLALPLNILIVLVKLPLFLITFPLVLLNVQLIKNFHLKFLFNFKAPTPKFKQNEFVVTNYTSPLLVYLLNGIVLIPDTDGVLYQYSPLQFLNHSFGINVKGTQVVDLAKLKNKVVFCLLEGASTNNKAVLNFTALKSSYSFDDFNLNTLIVKINPPYFNLPLPGSKLKFFYHLLVNKPSVVGLKLVKHSSFDIALSKVAFRNANLHTVNFGANDKIDFYNYYLKHI